MRAIICSSFNGIDGLSLDTKVKSLSIESEGLLEKKFNMIRIRVYAAGINFADMLIINGKYQVKPPFPFSPGFEVAGEVIEISTGVTSVSVGDRVIAIVNYGGYAEEVLAFEEDTYLIPDSMSWDLAAGFPIAYGTSGDALMRDITLNSGEYLVVNGAAGGVGLTAVEIGKQLGGVVIATAGSDDKLQIAKDHGADFLINYSKDNVAETIKKLTENRGADVIYDPVGGKIFSTSMRAVKQGGKIIVIGFASGAISEIPANIIMVKNILVIGYHFGGWRRIDPIGVRKNVNQLLKWYTEGKLRPHISNTFPLKDYKEALKLLQSRVTKGKIILEMT